MSFYSQNSAHYNHKRCLFTRKTTYCYRIFIVDIGGYSSSKQTLFSWLKCYLLPMLNHRPTMNLKVLVVLATSWTKRFIYFIAAKRAIICSEYIHFKDHHLLSIIAIFSEQNRAHIFHTTSINQMQSNLGVCFRYLLAAL
jgi:hypothetical protein